MEKDRLKKLAGINENKKISYSCILLDDQSKSEILKKFSDIIPNEWKVIAHHMTINLGNLRDEFGYEIGEEVILTAYSLGISEKAIAIGVDGRSVNKQSHVTVVVNVNCGGKPVDSNYIENWDPIDVFKIRGIVSEIGY